MKKVILATFIGLLAACSNEANLYVDSTSEIKVVKVGSELVDCVGVGPMKCLVVDGSLFYDGIQGFSFEEGYEYELEIEKAKLYTEETVPADASLYRYSLLKILTKEKVEH
ncbi:DUF4377 domain-containing protein [Vibrio aestuarianus]|uniref:DUF4377 domain-containing protein n=1 Tax=Vibrio aestuarianus TaxID=28171 RepID=A0ABD7YR13_9VIBR|nr:DUF4377 domain-containing protein [Vibrio aestuarianus]MDE1233315.1 DUF4377 domain-containing protein [Vibrio aestuarianus]WGK87420.1 DUF4377 domain-containing protein [Vibrio aestuarianus]CAH8239539.1 conserved exported hypothetical protein [Vibrio aestuarianus]